ncbi:MAG: AAA family ATPase [Eubacterium sp.]|nr:AAA family ATPase [Eubacterium sp.]
MDRKSNEFYRKLKPVVAIGAQNFKSIRESGAFYIDKTSFIKEWWENQDVVTLIIRPRRFGKTLNMSMTEHFFSNQYAGCADLFEGLTIWKDAAYRNLQGSYPVLFVSFAGIKSDSYETAREGIIQIIIDLYAKYRFLLQGDSLNVQEKDYFNYIEPGMSDAVAVMSLHRLTLCMTRYYGKKVILLLDEYDTPLQEAYVNGYWEKLTIFIRSLFHCTFKTNPYMERGLLTGITRIGKESIFSDLNNLEVVTTTSDKYVSSFGFTEEEVKTALELFDMTEKLEKVKFWYDGFRFGNKIDLYNPWSITKYLDRKRCEPYWVNTSSNNLIRILIQRGSPEIKVAFEDLLMGRQIVSALDEEIVFDQLEESDAAIWSFLLASGYLKADRVLETEEEGETQYCLSLTNLEVKKEFRKMVRQWFQNPSARYHDFIKALLAGDVDYMNEYMNCIALQTFSSFDTGKHPSGRSEPERFYHGFVLGLIVDLADRYKITSNRESGFGRYDVVMEPLQSGLDAFVMEFKVFHPEREKDLHETVKHALQQIAEKEYDADLIAGGIQKGHIRHYAIAFEGKHILVGSA